MDIASAVVPLLVERLLAIIGNANDYCGDAAYAEYLREGSMPHNKLRKHMSLQARPLSQLVSLAVERGLIVKHTRRNRPYPVTVYTLSQSMPPQGTETQAHGPNVKVGVGHGRRR